MSAGVSGNGFEQADAMVRQLMSLEEFVRELAKAASLDVQFVVEDQFARGVDPYGRPWQALAPSTVARKGHSTILVDRGSMRASVHVVPYEDRIVVRVETPAERHQDGTPHVPERQILPSDGDPIPPAYESAILAAAARVAERMNLPAIGGA